MKDILINTGDCLPYNPRLNEYAKKLRKDMTREERHLWYDYLRNTQERWIRQKIVDNYIVDFYCAKVKLVIEIDGSHHFTEDRIIYDEIRSNILQQYGIEVIRFTNKEIMLSFNGVCESIENSVMKLLKIFGQDT